MEQSSAAYIDSSVFLRIILDEPGPIKDLSSYQSIYSSFLLRLESHRTLFRLLKIGELSEDSYLKRIVLLNSLMKAINLVQISRAILSRAEQAFPFHLGSLDSIHLSTALTLRQHEISTIFMTHDDRLAKNAKALEFTVLGAV